MIFGHNYFTSETILRHFLRLLGCKKMTWSYFSCGVLENVILKNAVSERWCLDSNFHYGGQNGDHFQNYRHQCLELPEFYFFLS